MATHFAFSVQSVPKEYYKLLMSAITCSRCYPVATRHCFSLFSDEDNDSNLFRCTDLFIYSMVSVKSSIYLVDLI